MASKSLILVICLLSLAVVVQSIPGGLEEEKPADSHIQKVMAKIQSQLEKKFPRDFISVTPITYRTQVVAGMNYFIKALVTERGGKKSYVHLRVWDFMNDHELSAIKVDADEHEPLGYFQ